MQIDYNQENQPELVAAFAQLNSKMDNRVCVTAQQNLDSKVQIIQNRFSTEKPEEAWKEYVKLETIIAESENCQLDRSKLDAILIKNESFFQYQKEINQLDEMYLSKQYLQLIQQSIKLSNFFTEKNLVKYNLEEPALLQYVEKKSNPDLTTVAADYFISNSEFFVAFSYLKLLKKQHVTAKSTKELQEKIGVGLAKENKKEGSEKFDADSITRNDDWYKYFRSAYSGGIMGKLLFLTGHN
jgi:hypothetical protein